MSWISTLCETYDNNIDKAGTYDGQTYPLSMDSHILANARLEITIDDDGNFIEARELEKIKKDKNDKTNDLSGVTIIPVTEDSGGRSSGIVPHPLCDTLSYIAGDYAAYVPGKKDKEKALEKSEKYLENLKKWAESDYSHYKVRAVYKYLEKKTVIADLVRENVVELDSHGMISSKKICGETAERAMARFIIRSPEHDETEKCWEDKTLFQKFSEYYNSLIDDVNYHDICYVSGEDMAVCCNHPKGIVPSSYGAKMVCINTSNFVSLGRFIAGGETCAVGYDSTQKVHNALSWLVKNQGCVVGSKDKRTYICWCPAGKPTINPVDTRWGDEELGSCDTHMEYKEEIEKLFNGKSGVFSESDKVVLISLEAATTGRLSVTYYNELIASDFMERMTRWSETCCWYFKRKNSEGKYRDVIRTPDTKSIVKYAFGMEQGKFVELGDKVFKEQVQRIVHCIADKKPIPRDIVYVLMHKASNPQSYKMWMNYQNVLSTACAMTAKYYNDLEGKVKYGMNLDKNNTDRSYLFGRLLAIAEIIEYRTYKNDAGGGRLTNATQLQSAFVNHPWHTWSVLEKKLIPYYKQTDLASVEYYKSLIGGIIEQLQTDSPAKLNMPLRETYLLGYYHQRKEMFTKKEEDK